MKKILITGARLPFALHLARLFHASGCEVYVADSMKSHHCRFSNSVKKSFHVPSPKRSPQEFVEELSRICEVYNVDMLVPVNEEIIYIARQVECFPKSVKIYSDSYDKLIRLHNKLSFIRTLEKYGFDVPSTVIVEKKSDLETFQIKTPFALKQCYTRSSQNVVKVENKQSLPKIKFIPQNPWIMQEWIEGKRFCSYSVCHNGKVLANVIYPVQYAIDNAGCLTYESIENKRIENWIKEFVGKEDFTGQIAFDFIQTDSKLFAVECNPRATSGIFLFNRKDKIVDAFFAKDSVDYLSPKGRKKQLLPGMIMFGWRVLPSGKGYADYLKQLISAGDVFFCFRDLKPFLIQPYLFIHLMRAARKLKTTIPNVSLYDLEWNGEF